MSPKSKGESKGPAGTTQDLEAIFNDCWPSSAHGIGLRSFAPRRLAGFSDVPRFVESLKSVEAVAFLEALEVGEQPKASVEYTEAGNALAIVGEVAVCRPPPIVRLDAVNAELLGRLANETTVAVIFRNWKNGHNSLRSSAWQTNLVELELYVMIPMAGNVGEVVERNVRLLVPLQRSFPRFGVDVERGDEVGNAVVQTGVVGRDNRVTKEPFEVGAHEAEVRMRSV